MIEAELIKYLSEVLHINVYAEKPDGKVEPKQYIVLDKTGSSRTNYFNRTTIALQSYSDTKLNASMLNEKVKDAMFNMDLDKITKVELNSDYYYPYESHKKYRYQALFDIYHY